MARSPPGITHRLWNYRLRSIAAAFSIKAAVRSVCDNPAGNPVVFRTDVNRYFAGIGHDGPMAQLREKLDDPIVLVQV